KYNNRFDYSEINWVNRKTKIDIICKICNNKLSQTPDEHLHWKSSECCKYCRDIENEKHFIKRADKIHNSKFDYSEMNWVNGTIKVVIICKEHNIKFRQTPNGHLGGSNGCS